MCKVHGGCRAQSKSQVSLYVSSLDVIGLHPFSGPGSFSNLSSVKIKRYLCLLFNQTWVSTKSCIQSDLHVLHLLYYALTGAVFGKSAWWEKQVFSVRVSGFKLARGCPACTQGVMNTLRASLTSIPLIWSGKLMAALSTLSITRPWRSKGFSRAGEEADADC